MQYIIWTEAKTKIAWSSQQMQKKPLTKPVSFHASKQVNKIRIDYLNLKKPFMKNLLPISYWMGKSLKACPVKLGIRERCSLSPLSFNNAFETWQEQLGKKKKWKGTKEVWLSLFAHHMIQYIDDPPKIQQILRINQIN